MIEQSYSLSFTASSLRKQESLKLASLYLQCGNWGSVRVEVMQNNLLQQRTTSSTMRIYQELVIRLKHLTEDELAFLVNGTETDKSLLLWISVCRHYQFIRDFVTDVLQEHRHNLNPQLTYSDFDAFFNAKLVLHEELDHITDSTRRKVRQVLFRMLREVGLVSKENSITSVTPSTALLKLLERNDLRVTGVSNPNEQAVTSAK